MSSRSRLNDKTIIAIDRVPPSALVGGTTIDYVLYHLYQTIYHANMVVDDTSMQYLETVLRRIVSGGIVDSTMFDTNGNLKRSVLLGE